MTIGDGDTLWTGLALFLSGELLANFDISDCKFHDEG